jgi:hypothetical protein
MSSTTMRDLPIIVFSNVTAGEAFADKKSRRRSQGYLRDPEASIRGWYGRARELGYRRMMLLQPTGYWGPGPDLPAADWRALEAGERDAHEEELGRWVGEGREVYLYTGRVTDGEGNAFGGRGTPWLWERADRTREFALSLLPWLERGVTRLWVDGMADAPQEEWEWWWAVSGALVCQESVPLWRSPISGTEWSSYDLDQRRMGNGPAMVMLKTLLDRDPELRMVVHGWEAHAWLNDGEATPGTDEELVTLIRKLRSRGWVVSGECAGRGVVQAEIVKAES